MGISRETIRHTERTTRTSPRVDTRAEFPADAVTAFCARSAANGRPYVNGEVHDLDGAWLVEFCRPDGTPATIRIIVDGRGNITAYTASADVNTTIAQYRARRR